MAVGKEVVQLVWLARDALSLLPSPQCSSELGAWRPATSPLPTVQLRAGRMAPCQLSPPHSAAQSWRMAPCPRSPLRSAAQSWVHPLSLATSFPPPPLFPSGSECAEADSLGEASMAKCQNCMVLGTPEWKREKRACRKSPWEYPEKGVPYASPQFHLPKWK